MLRSTLYEAGALAAVALAATASASATQSADARTPLCGTSRLSGSFRVVPGSAGAGHIVYTLRLRNNAHRACRLLGIPRLTLLDRRGRALPTRVEPFVAGALTAPLTVRPGHLAVSDARFSPDIPSGGEPTGGPCERTAHRLLLRPRGVHGTLAVSIRPPTPVCERGTLTFRPLQ
jgi:hypothetical protein